MPQSPQARRTFGLRLLSGGTELASRFSLDFDQRLFRRNYRRPILISAALAAEGEDVSRWLGSGAAVLLGCDVAARALNRIASEGAEPLYLHAVLSGGTRATRDAVRSGVADACIAADCTDLSGPDADASGRGSVSVVVSVTGVVERSRMMNPRRFEPGDVVLGVGSDRVWGSAVESARAALASHAAGTPLPGLPFDADGALVQPAPVLAGHLGAVLRRYTVKRVVHAMVPIEGDGLAAGLGRLTGRRFEVKPARSRRSWSALLDLLADGGLSAGDMDEAHLKGIGFLMVVSEPFAGAIARRLRRLGAPTWPFGRLVAP